MTISVKDALGVAQDFVSRLVGGEHIGKHDIGLIDLPTAIVNMQKTVATPGTALQFTASATPLASVAIVKALSTNTDLLYVGGVGVDSTNGLELEAGESVVLAIDDLSEIWLDVAVGGEGASVLAS